MGQEGVQDIASCVVTIRNSYVACQTQSGFQSDQDKVCLKILMFASYGLAFKQHDVCKPREMTTDDDTRSRVT